MLCLGFLVRDIDIWLRVHVRHVAAVRVLVPVEREGGHLVVLPRVDRVEGRVAPIKCLVFGVIGWAVDNHNEFFILGPDETLPNTVPDEVTERVVIRVDVDEDDGCCDSHSERGRVERVILRHVLRLLWILSWFQVTTSRI